jgi:hypothetical protein
LPLCNQSRPQTLRLQPLLNGVKQHRQMLHFGSTSGMVAM